MGIEYGSVAQWASAIASTAAVCVALFGNQLRRVIDRPRLHIDLSDGAGTWRAEQRKEDGSVKEGPRLWFHIRATNPNKYPPIHNAQIILKRVDIKDIVGKYQKEWNGSVGMHWRWAVGGDLFKDISRPYECDILRIIDGPALELTTAEQGVHKKRYTGPLSMKLYFEAIGAEVESNELIVTVVWDGQFVNDREEMARHISVTGS